MPVFLMADGFTGHMREQIVIPPEEDIRLENRKIPDSSPSSPMERQVYPYIKAEAAHACRVDFLGPKTMGQIHDPETILARIKETIR